MNSMMESAGPVEASTELGGQWTCLLPVITALTLILATRLHVNIAKRRRRCKWRQAGQDVVVLHCPRRGRFAPSLSPFVIKLETFFRLADIPYKTDFEEPYGPKGKTPWITFNGEELEDSQLVIEKLAHHFQLKNNLTKTEEATARAITVMMDEHLIWGMRVWRYDIDKGAGFQECFRHVPSYASVALPLFCWRMRRALWHQGIGRHTFAQVQDIVRKDLSAVSHFLGEKTYLLGEEPSIADCAVFAHLANIVYNYRRSPFLAMVTEEFPNLEDYVERVRNRLWPDWNQCVDPPVPKTVQ